MWEVPGAVFWERKETVCSLRGLEERLLAFCFREETEADAKAEVEGLGVGTQAVLGGRTEEWHIKDEPRLGQCTPMGEGE